MLIQEREQFLEAMVDAWRQHPDLHAAGALMPIALHFGGDQLLAFCSTVLPRHLTAAAAYLSFVLEFTPLLGSTDGTKDLTVQSGALKPQLGMGLEPGHA